MGLKTGDLVTYEGKEHEILRISGDGTSLTLEDERGREIKAVAPSECTLIKVQDDETPPPPRQPARSSRQEEEEEAPRRPARREETEEDEDRRSSRR
jgi:hypothetical protein